MEKRVLYGVSSRAWVRVGARENAIRKARNSARARLGVCLGKCVVDCFVVFGSWVGVALGFTELLGFNWLFVLSILLPPLYCATVFLGEARRVLVQSCFVEIY